MQAVISEPVVSDTITITEVRADPEFIHAAAAAEVRWDSHDADHHIIVVSGTCRVLDRRIEAGASAFVPAGIAHTVKAGAWGCSFLSLDTASKEI